jgi:hypothetical protein
MGQVYSPVRLARIAVKNQLADPVLGLNPNIVRACDNNGDGIAPWSFDFTDGSRNFAEGNITYKDSEATDIPQKNLLTLYGARTTPFSAGRRLFQATFSGAASINCDMYIGVLAERIQPFENYADAAEDAMVATMNNLQNSGGMNVLGKVYAMDVASNRGKCQFDGENWIVPISFTLSFEMVIS